VAALPLFLLLATPLLVSNDGMALAQKAGPGSTTQFAFLDLDGNIVGLLPSAQGGDASADVITEKIGADGIQKKHIGGVKYSDITVTSDLPMASGLASWLSESLARTFKSKNGAIVTADHSFNEFSRLNFSNALISQLTIPALDAGSKDAAKLTIKFTPETTRFVHGSGKAAGGVVPKTHHFIASNFRLEIDGLDCRKVMKIDSFSATLVTQQVTIGDSGGTQLKPVSWNFSNLHITLPEAAAKSFIDWHEDFVIKGNNSDDMEKSGSLTFLASDLKTVLAHINFSHIGIYNLTRPTVVSGTTAGIRRITVDLYFENMQWVLPSKGT
jgi:hypothetical protein